MHKLHNSKNGNINEHAGGVESLHEYHPSIFMVMMSCRELKDQSFLLHSIVEDGRNDSGPTGIQACFREKKIDID
jgi:hypothetical protein